MAMNTTNGSSILTPEQVAALVVIPLIAESVATQASTVVNIATHDLRVPIVTDDPNAGWVAEGAEIGVSDATLDEITITPKKLAGLTVISSELATDSNPAALKVVGDGLVRDIKTKLDAAYFGTTVANGPSGLGSLTPTVIDAGDAWTNLDWAESARTAAENLGTTVDTFVANPTTALALAQLKEQTGSNKGLLGNDPTAPTKRVIAGIPLLVSPAVANNVVWGIPRARSIVAVRTGTTVVTDSSVFFTSDRIAIRATLRVGFGWPHQASVIKVNITP